MNENSGGWRASLCGGAVRLKQDIFICLAPFHENILTSKVVTMARVNEGSHRYTCHPHAYPQVVWAILPLIPTRSTLPHFGQYSFPVPQRVGGWVGLSGWLHTEEFTRWGRSVGHEARCFPTLIPKWLSISGGVRGSAEPPCYVGVKAISLTRNVWLMWCWYLILSSVEEHIFLPKMNQNAKFYKKIKKYSGVLSRTPAAGGGAHARTLPRLIPCFRPPSIFDALPSLPSMDLLFLQLHAISIVYSTPASSTPLIGRRWRRSWATQLKVFSGRRCPYRGHQNRYALYWCRRVSRSVINGVHRVPTSTGPKPQNLNPQLTAKINLANRTKLDERKSTWTL